MLTTSRSYSNFLILSILLPGLACAQSIIPYVINTIAGSYPLGDGGQAAAAMLEFPSAVAIDKDGSIFVADTENKRIRKITAAGSISTFASVKAVDIKLDSQGNVYAADG